MSIKDYIEYLDDTHGILPERSMKTGDSFNNVVYHAHLLFARATNSRLTQEDINIFREHLRATKDKDGLYAPKNSKDNLIAKTAVCYKLALSELHDMKLIPMVTSSWLNPWDAFFYIYCKAGKVGKFLITPFLLITYFQMWRAVSKLHKVRPHLWERILWTLQGKKYDLRYYVNDGKHLALLKAYALKRDFPRLTRFIRDAYIKRYKGKKEYAYIIFYAIFKDKGHPVIKEWERAGDKELLL